jgi:hypothetical protein
MLGQGAKVRVLPCGGLAELGWLAGRCACSCPGKSRHHKGLRTLMQDMMWLHACCFAVTSLAGISLLQRLMSRHMC